MHAYGLSGGPAAKQPLLWQDRRDRSVVADKTETEQKWWAKFKKTISSSEPPPAVAPSRVFSKDKGVLGGRMVMNLATEIADTKPQSNKNQLFRMEGADEGPSRPQLNLRDIESQFRPLEEVLRPTQSEAFILRPPQAESSPDEVTPPSKPRNVLHPMVHYQTQLNQVELTTSSETKIIRPPSPFLDPTRRRPPPIPQQDFFEPAPAQGEGRPRRKLTSVSRPLSFADNTSLVHSEQPSEKYQKSHFVKEAVNLFEKKNPNFSYAATELISIKIPNKAKNARQRSRGPSRTPSDPDLSRQWPPPPDLKAESSAENRLSKSYEFNTMDTSDHSRGRSISDAASLDSRLDSLEPQVKEKKASVFRGLINATRGKIDADSDTCQEKSNTEPSRRKVKCASSSVNPVKSETTMGQLGESVTSSFGLMRKKQRKPRHLELQEGFDVKAFDNFMMY